MNSGGRIDGGAVPSSTSLFVHRSGTGPAVVLVHGGMPARVTWGSQRPLESRWSLIVPSRRGFPPSPAAPRQDFLADADDLAELVAGLTGEAHLVGFSYGGLGVAIAAERLPHRVRSLTLIEVPLWNAAEEDESVRALAALSDRFVARADDAQAEREFFALAGLDGSMRVDDDVRQAMELGRKLRSPWEARPRLDAIAAARIPALVVSGAHHGALERLCDAVAAQLGAQRARLPGAGHAVQRAPGFNSVLERFLTASERGRDDGGDTHER